MAQDISWLGNTYSDVPEIYLPKSTSGEALFIDPSPTTAEAADVAAPKIFFNAQGVQTVGTGSGGGGGAYAWFGANAEKVNTVINKTINLSTDTSYDSWSASTTATTIKAASSTPDYTLSNASGDYDYCFLTKIFCQPVYNAGTTLNATIYRFAAVFAYAFYGFPNRGTIADMQSGSPIGTSVNKYENGLGTGGGAVYANAIYYYNSSGVLASYATPYGPMYTDVVPSISVTASNGKLSATYTIPAIKARCNSSRFATSMKTQVNSAATNMSITVDLIRCPRGNGFGSAQFKTMMDMINAA